MLVWATLELQSAEFLWRQFHKFFQRFHEINSTRQLFSKLAFVAMKRHGFIISVFSRLHFVHFVLHFTKCN